MEKDNFTMWVEVRKNLFQLLEEKKTDDWSVNFFDVLQAVDRVWA